MVPGDSGMNLRGGALLGQIARSGDRGLETEYGQKDFPPKVRNDKYNISYLFYFSIFSNIHLDRILLIRKVSAFW